ncbi:hypothetical protein HYPSUDRAFT_521102 [Hypholoma sublateritium FD-334 SS-4]|uniref:Uncharacterized protein n=1 Tax=Hypholoma sublateritium (strain FD-334 SS-4) TaxID=945553 RepID=A0A0D2PFD2_HYPSF|nr:hypothetical protein HYPSUDRAFT_521102 [Hypholoma sublateritium FD-334 SS-4]
MQRSSVEIFPHCCALVLHTSTCTPYTVACIVILLGIIQSQPSLNTIGIYLDNTLRRAPLLPNMLTKTKLKDSSIHIPFIFGVSWDYLPYPNPIYRLSRFISHVAFRRTHLQPTPVTSNVFQNAPQTYYSTSSLRVHDLSVRLFQHDSNFLPSGKHITILCVHLFSRFFHP